MEKMVEERRNLSLSHRVLMMERRKMRHCESIDVTSLLPVIDPRGRILEETISSEASDLMKVTPKHSRLASQHDAMTAMTLTVDKAPAVPLPASAHRSPLPVHNLNEDSGLNFLPSAAPTGCLRSRPMTESHTSRRSTLEQLRARPPNPRPKSTLMSLNMEAKPETSALWIHTRHPLRSSIDYIEDIDKRRAQLLVSPQLQQKRQRDHQHKEAKVKRSLELLSKVQQWEGVRRKASRSVFDEEEIVQWRSGRLGERT